MAKLSKTERAEVEKNLAVCRAACETFQAMLDSDDAADKAATADRHAAVVNKIVAGGTGDARTATARGVLAIREAGGTRIADVVHNNDRTK